MIDSERKLTNDFNKLKQPLELWGKKVDEIITELTKKLKNRIIIPQHYRTKSVDSFISKALYRKKNYDNPLRDICDKVGTRIVLLTMDDVEYVSQIISNYDEWNIECTRDIKENKNDNPSNFDYQSIHYAVWPKNFTYYSLDQLDYLKCEIQIRTILQHTYAEVSHDNIYKGPYKDNPKINRNLAKAMALMECADDKFCDIYKSITKEEMNSDLKFYNELRLFYINQLGLSPTDDMELSESVFVLFHEKPVTMKDIENLINSNQDIVTIIKNQNQHVFKTPIIFLIVYYLYNHNVFLKKWDISVNIKKMVYKGFDFSYDIL